MTLWNPTNHVDGTTKDSLTSNTNENDLLTVINGKVDSTNVNELKQRSLGKQTLTQLFKDTTDKLGLHFWQNGYTHNSNVSKFAYMMAARDQDSPSANDWVVLPGMAKLVNVDYNARLFLCANASFTVLAKDTEIGGYTDDLPVHEHNYRTYVWATASYIALTMPNLMFEVALFCDDGTTKTQLPGSLQVFSGSGCMSVDGVTIFNDTDATAYPAITRSYEKPSLRSGAKGHYAGFNQYDAPTKKNSKIKVTCEIRPVWDGSAYNYDDGTGNVQHPYVANPEILDAVKASILGVSCHSSELAVLTIKHSPAIMP